MNISLKKINTASESTYIKDIKISISSPLIIGRGSLLKCADKKVSRCLGLLIFEEENLVIKSTHSSPLHLKKCNGMKSLLNGQSEKLTEGDQFGLLKDSFWYKICIPDNGTEKNDKPARINVSAIELNEEISNSKIIPTNSNIKKDESQQENITQLKRSLPDWMQKLTQKNSSLSNGENEPTLKKLKASSSDNKVEQQQSLQKDLSNLELVCNENQNRVDSKIDAAGNEKENTELCSIEESPKHKPAKRQVCPYAAKCYRKNPLHRQQFAHPNDSDYQSDIEDDGKPECEFGNKCYRKNFQHRIDFRHTRKRQPRRKATVNVRTSGERSSEDDYDYEDPFIDDSSDDYCPTGSETESEGTL